MKKSRILATLLVVVMALATLCGCGGKKSGKTFIVGFDAEFPPYGYMDDNGNYVGFDLDLAEEVCKRIGYKLEKKPIDWDAKDALIDSGEIDCIWNGFTINGREDDYTWSVPYVNNSQVYVVSAKSGISTPADLSGKVIGVQKASAALDALESEDNAELMASFASVKQYDSYVIAFEDLAGDGIDALAIDIGVAQAQISKRNAADYVILAECLSAEQYGVGFKLGNTELRDKVEKALFEMYKDGTVAKIAEKYGIDETAICLGEYVK